MGKPSKGMNAAAWSSCVYPGTMLPHLRTGSPRKLRLFVCACCERIQHLFVDERSKQAVEAAARWADGKLSAKELKAKHVAAFAIKKSQLKGTAFWAARAAAQCALPRKSWVVNTAFCVRIAISQLRERQHEEERYQCDLIRDIFGNPFAPVIADPSWFRSSVTQLAEAIYEERAFDRMPILGDALEDAGCTNADMLMHCRQPAQHVRGCWVVDLVLGRK
jgi:hypothetical protein